MAEEKANNNNDGNTTNNNTRNENGIRNRRNLVCVSLIATSIVVAIFVMGTRSFAAEREQSGSTIQSDNDNNSAPFMTKFPSPSDTLAPTSAPIMTNKNPPSISTPVLLTKYPTEISGPRSLLLTSTTEASSSSSSPLLDRRSRLRREV
eukprot:CAMPEP_0194207022 /NCGR_PEP_ID=MMETSP0156-20130528/5896_1 /TAXON_ID=33649 /ORGANISM="Thalassionema nitzschioides, Strain L26-B" /LENGTH=148 /DNA_ID=CAMNT_0038933693 /DNA_START=27 /DNA_END=473 /DNA_ORIENTATION=+